MPCSASRVPPCGHPVAELGDHEPRLDRLHAHAARAELQAQGARQVLDGGLGRAVDGVVGERLVPADRADVDEVGGAAVGRGCEQVVDEGAAGGEQAADVDVEHLAPLVRVGLLERRAEHHAGVGDDEVDRAERCVDAVGECGRARRRRESRRRARRVRRRARCRRSSRRPTSATDAPAACRARAVAVPMPAVAPVTTAVRLLRSMPRSLRRVRAALPDTPVILVATGPGWLVPERLPCR